MNLQSYHQKWLKRHDSYVKRGVRYFRKEIRKGLTIPYERLTLDNYQVLIELNTADLLPIFINYYTWLGELHGRQVLQELPESKNFETLTFKEIVTNWLLTNGGEKIRIMRANLVEHLIKFITTKIEGDGTDIRTIAKKLEEYVTGRRFYRWQIMRIVQTETTTAANFATKHASRSSRIELEKIWISSNDARTRRRPDDLFDHAEMHQIKVGENELFNVNGDLIDFPGDPKSHPANRINCRCTFAWVPKRDENGRLIFRGVQRLQPSIR